MRWSSERRFYTGMALALLAVVFVGFARSFFLRPWFPDYRAARETIFYVHGGVFTTWFLLLVVQPSLIALGRTDLHRALGRFGAVLAAVMIVFGTFVSLVASARSGGFINVPIPPLKFLAVPLFDMVLFALFVGLAIAKRNVAQAHKRLMLLASISIVMAAVVRVPLPFMKSSGPLGFFGVTDLFLVALVIWDFATRRRLHPVTLWGGLLLIVSMPLRRWLSGTDYWLRFAEWAVGIVR